MCMLVLLIGPSDAGKSALGEYARERFPCAFYDLDQLVANEAGLPPNLLFERLGADCFLERCQRLLERIGNEAENSAGLSLVAVGAGSLEAAGVAEWLKPYSTIAILAPAEEVYARDRTGRTFADFVAREYAPERQALYDATTWQFSVAGLDLQTAQRRFLAWLRRKFGHGEGRR